MKIFGKKKKKQYSPQVNIPYAQTSDLELNRVNHKTSGGAQRIGNLVPPDDVYSSSIT